MKPVFFGAALLLLPGCACHDSACNTTAYPVRPGVINHVVFFKLVDPSDADELIADCDERLASIPVVSGYYAGEHFDAGRDNVQTDYDVGAFVAFGSAEDYQTYLVHPDHVALVNKWRPRLESLRIYDVKDAAR